MAFNIICKRTTELNDEEIKQIYDLFFLIFEKKRPYDFFRQQFENTSKGYSYHAIALDEGQIIGHNVYIPFDYNFGDHIHTVAISVDAMVHPGYRGQGIYEKLASSCEENAAADGCALRLGFPNENSYPIQMRKFHYTHIGELTTYCLPIKVSAFKSKLRFLDTISAFCAKVLISMGWLRRNNKLISPHITVRQPAYDGIRYRWFGGKYNLIENAEFKVHYKIDDFKGTTAAFILDVSPLSPVIFERAVREVYNRVKSQVPFILYVGNLPFTPISLIKIPEKFSPKNFHVVGKTLTDEFSLSHWQDLSQWKLNLASFDLL